MEDVINYNFPPDLYSRNYFISKGISEFKKRNFIKKVRILDIGGINGQIEKFIDSDDELFILDKREIGDSLSNLIIGDATQMTMFKDKSFDIVISGDVFEHIPQDKRDKFIAESFRVAKYLIIHAVPFHSEPTKNYESLIQEFFTETVGYDHIWLKEHSEEGLPNRQDFERAITEKGYKFKCIGSNSIINWLLIQYLDILKTSFNFSNEIIQDYYIYYNKNFRHLEINNEIFYRYVYFITKENYEFDFEYNLDYISTGIYLSKIFKNLNNSYLDLKNSHILTISTLESKIDSLENEIFKIKSTKSWKIADFFGHKYFLIHYFISCIKHEIDEKGFFQGSLFLFFLFNTRILKVNTKIGKKNNIFLKNFDKNTHIVFLSGCDGDTQRYRVAHQIEELKFNDFHADSYDINKFNYSNALDKYHIFILHRVPITPQIKELILKGKKIGKIFIFETDDLIFHEDYAKYIRYLEDFNSEQVTLYIDGLRRFNETMQLCDFAICSTEYLQYELEVHGKRAYINLNAVSNEMVKLARKALSQRCERKSEKIRIGYLSGTKTHNLDFKVAEDAIIRILTEFKNVELFIGGFLDLSEKFSIFSERIIRLPFIDWRKLPQYLISFDINIAPLEDNPFCNAKSDLKYFESALLKVPTIASNIGGYKTQIRNYDNGIIVSTSDEWYDALKTLIINKEIREDIGNKAFSDVINKRTTKVIGKNLIHIIQNIKRENLKNVKKSPLSGLYSPNEWPKFSIVSVLYNKEKEIKYFLESLYSQKYKGTFEIIFVDDCSTDNSAQSVLDFINVKRDTTKVSSYPEITILNNSSNIGNCNSRNWGIQHANGDIILVIDADCMLNQDFLTLHAEAYKFNDFDVSVGPYNLETSHRDPFKVLEYYENNPQCVEQDSQLQDQVNKRSFLNCITRNFCIKREFISEDLFDPLFSYSTDPNSGFGWEDVEMGYRLYKRGARIAYIPNAFSIHISHPSSIEEKEKPIRSIHNFKKLYEKHPELLLTSRRWTLDTYTKITHWMDTNKVKENVDKNYLEKKFQRFLPPRFYTSHRSERNLKILTYRWHCSHQYELFKLPYEFTLVNGIGTGIAEFWDYDRRPLPENVSFKQVKELNINDYDLAILPFDENVLSPYRTNGIIRPEWKWGDTFKWFMKNVTIPKIAICHGTPQFYGQYTPGYSKEDLMQPIEEEKIKFCDILKDTLVINNSFQAQKEWNFKKSKVIWHGFDPTEFPKSIYEKGILVMSEKAMMTRPHYNGYTIYTETMKNFPKKFSPTFLKVNNPNKAYGTNNNWYAYCKFDNYIRGLGKYSVYFNPTIRSPMPRTRGEAMMCGLAIVSTKNHDVELFIKNGVNGFFSNDPVELREYLLYLSENPSLAQEIGEAGRETAMDIFNHDRFLMEWEKTIKSVLK